LQPDLNANKISNTDNVLTESLPRRIGDEAMFVLVDFSESDVKQAVLLALKNWAREKSDVVNLHWTPNAVGTLTEECLKVCLAGNG
jgi:hypothetical protein